MKRGIFVSCLLLALFASLLSPAAFGQVKKVVPDKVQIAWNEVTTNIEDQPITDVYYEVYTISVGADRTDETAWRLAVVTDTLNAVVSFGGLPMGEYVVGVRSAYMVGETPIVSEMNWSDVNGLATPEPFVVVYGIPGKMPLGLRILDQ